MFKMTPEQATRIASLFPEEPDCIGPLACSPEIYKEMMVANAEVELGLVKREERKVIEAKFHKQAKPSVLSNYYLVYRTLAAAEFPKAFTSPCLMGFDSFEEAEKVQEMMASRVTASAIVDEFPYEVMAKWSEK